MTSSPTFSVVVPSFNQKLFLRDCLESLVQYPADVCEILVMDGGSTDGSVDVIRDYDTRLAYWQSCPDGGQAAALVAGFNRATGSIFGWLNSDDRLVAGALDTVGRYFRAHPEVEWAYGDHAFIDVAGRRVLSRYVAAQTYQELYWGGRYLPQEAVFFRREIYFRAGEIDASLRLTMDFDLWLRMGRLAEPGKIQATLGEFRRHDAQKTSEFDGYHEAARRTREQHPAPPRPSAFLRAAWAVKHRAYRFIRTAGEHGAATAVADVARSLSCLLRRR